TRPSAGRSSPSSVRMSVVLPAPLGPSKPKISPRRTRNDTPRSASTLPNRFTMFSTTIASTPVPPLPCSVLPAPRPGAAMRRFLPRLAPSSRRRGRAPPRAGPRPASVCPPGAVAGRSHAPAPALRPLGPEPLSQERPDGLDFVRLHRVKLELAVAAHPHQPRGFQLRQMPGRGARMHPQPLGHLAGKHLAVSLKSEDNGQARRVAQSREARGRRVEVQSRAWFRAIVRLRRL